MDTERVQSAFLGSKPRIAGSAAGGLVVLVVLAFLLGVVGVPGVGAVENRFAGVNNSTTVVETDMTVTNPNPVGVSLSDTTVDYTVEMNDVSMATGQREGLSIEPGNSTLQFRTHMRNDRIPPWWHSHIENGERTNVTIDAVVRSGLLGGRSVRIPQERTIETDLIGQFNSSETRPVEADRSFPSDPLLFINETTGQWDRETLSRQRTPMRITFDAYNPKTWPYAVSEISYTITMNGVQVGQGSSEDVATILPETRQTLGTTVAIRNTNLDDWWVTHLRNDQVTEMEIEFYARIDPAEDAVDGGLGGSLAETGSIQIPLEPLDYRTTIETDMFGTKNETATGTGDADDSDEDGRLTPTAPTDGTDDGSIGGGDGTSDGDDGRSTATTDGDGSESDDDGGGLLG